MPAPGHEIVSASHLRDESIQFQHIMLYLAIHPFQPALSRTPARKNFWGSTASPSILVS
jgi:hypothetical protein